LTTATAQMVRPVISQQRWTKLLAPLAGLGLIGGLVALFATPAGEDSGETAADVVAYAASHGSWTIATLLFGLASIALSGAFVAGVYSRLQSVATSTESALVLIGGTVFALCFALCWIVWGAPLDDMPEERARALAQAEAYLGYDDIGWFLLGAAGMGAAVMAVPASLAALRGGLPGWLGWLGVALGIASLGTVAFLGMFAWMAWIVLASIVMLVARSND
jgi:hypothetical protein